MDLSEPSVGGQLRHPWQTARLFALKRFVRRAGLSSPRVLDIGCGDGFVVKSLMQRCGFSKAVGQDLHLTDELGQTRSTPNVRLTRELAADDTQEFDLLVVLDVVEHVRDPIAFMAGLVNTRLAAGGAAVLTVPAYQALLPRPDRALHHYRRYSVAEIAEQARESGLEVEESGYFFASLLLPRVLTVLAERFFKAGAGRGAQRGVGGWQGGTWVTAALEFMSRTDARVCLAAQQLGLRLPGLSAWIRCRKA